MKKIVSYLVLGVLLFIPSLAFAAENITVTLEPNETPISSETVDDTHSKKVYSINANVTGASTEKITTFDITFLYGSAIQTFKCEDAGNFKVKSQKEVATGEVRCVYEATSDNAVTASTSGTTAEVARISIVVDNTASDSDCTVNVRYNGSEGKSNPTTGVSIPYAIIGGGVLLAGIVYVVTKRNTKLYKI